MDYITITAIALGLSFDTFAASLTYGVVRKKIIITQAAKIATVLALFQGGMAIGGYFLGSLFSDILKAVDHWAALLLLTFAGVKMIYEGIRMKDENLKEFRRIISLITVAVGTSIDAFVVGFSFALLNIMIWEIGIVIAAVTFLASMTAIRIGKAAGSRLGQRVEIIGGLILISIGLKIFLEHMFSQ
jgi:manganese efflux pump family protein